MNSKGGGLNQANVFVRIMVFGLLSSPWGIQRDLSVKWFGVEEGCIKST